MLLLCCGGGSFAIFKFANSGGASSPEGAVDTFLEAATEQDADKAKDVVCDAKKSDVKLNDFGGSVGSSTQTQAVRDALKNATWTISDDHEVSSKEHEVTARFTIPPVSGTTDPVHQSQVQGRQGRRLEGLRRHSRPLTQLEPGAAASR